MWSPAVRRKSLVAALLSIVLLAGSSGSARAGKKDKNEQRSFQILKPTVELTAAEGYAEVREIGGVRIELSSVPFTVKPMYVVSVQPRESAWETFTGVRIGQGAPVWIGVMPFYEVAPKNVQLHVRVTNHLGRVLRLDGVALQFEKDGNPVETGQTSQSINKATIVPEKSWEGVLEGPPLQAFGLKEFDARTGASGLLQGEATASEGTLLVGLYDVITEVDEASAPKKRSNFEWVFAYKAKVVPENAEALRWKARLTSEQAQKIMGVHSPDDFSAMLPGDAKH